MDDPFPIRSGVLGTLSAPLSSYLNLHTLPLHIHEVLFFFLLYSLVQSLSPRVSSYFAPRIYPALPFKTRLSWDVHVVSFVQSTLIDIVALWAMARDHEARKGLDSFERVWGYTGIGGLIQAMAAGYFAWDLMVTARNVEVFGVGMLAHATSALTVYLLGFRPFVNFYAPNFILFELSSPFLNVHWFLDKLNMTGSRPQWWNGMLLLGTFFCCRLVWGTYSSIRVFWDIVVAIRNPGLPAAVSLAANATFTNTIPLPSPTSALQALDLVSRGDIVAPARLGDTRGVVPMWLAAAYLAANLTLNSLNFFWFGKMIETVLKRFREVPRKEDNKKEVVLAEEITKTKDESGARVTVVEQVSTVRRRPNNSIPDELGFEDDEDGVVL